MKATRSPGVAMRLGVVAALLALAPMGTHAVLPAAGWVPASQGLVPMAGADNSFAPPYIYPITRLRPDPAAPGRVYAGHLFHGLYVLAGGAWTSLTPGCALPRGNGERETLLAASGLTACGVIDIAIDPHDPKIVYVTAVDPRGTLGSPQFEAGGVFRSTDGGARWTRISKPFRAGGLAVARTATGKAVIVAGSFQRASHDVGTTTSLIVSTDGGANWRGAAFAAPSGCPANMPAVSSRLVASAAIHPANHNILYAGTNAGLFMSTNKGATWTLALQACGKYSGIHSGGAWGIAFGRLGSATVVYAATWDGVVRRAAPGSKSWTTVAALNATYVRDLIVDSRSPSRLYASAFGAARAPGVYRITGSSAVAIEDNALGAVTSRLGAAPKVYNLSKDRATPSIAQHPLAPDLLYAATVLGGVFIRSEG